MYKINHVEIVKESPNNSHGGNIAYDARLMPGNKHVYVVSGQPLNSGDVFPCNRLKESLGLGQLAFTRHSDLQTKRRKKVSMGLKRLSVLSNMLRA